MSPRITVAGAEQGPREMVSRVVKDLESRGLIEQNDGRIVLREGSRP